MIDMEIINSCSRVCRGRASVKAHGKVAMIIRKDGKEIHVVEIDGCVITGTQQKRCDYLIYTDILVYFIELKGIDVSRGCEQLYETIKKFNNHHICLNKNIKAVVVSASYPGSFRPKHQIWEKRFSKVGVKLKIVSREFKEEIC